MNVLIPSVGRKYLLALALRNALEKRGGTLIAADLTTGAAGGFGAHIRATLPPFDPDSPEFMRELDGLISERKIEAIIPVRDAELAGWAKLADSGRISPRVFVSPVETLAVCFDKWRLAETANRAEVPTPHTALHRPGEELDSPPCCPAMMKPRYGSGSRGVLKAPTLRVLYAHMEDAAEEFLIQRYVEGMEFSVDAYATADGQLRCPVVRKRVSTVGGQSDVGETVHDEEIAALCLRLASVLRFRGPVNFQFIRGLHGPLLIDVNPRFSGAWAISRAAGADLAEWTVADLHGEPLSFPDSYPLITWVGYSDGMTVLNPR